MELCQSGKVGTMIHIRLGGALLARIKVIVNRSDNFYNFYQNYVS